MYTYSTLEGNYPLFSFSTKHGLNYYVAFRKMDFDNLFFYNLYSFDFWEINSQKFLKDNAIEATIIKIVIDFFKHNPSCLLHYICDSVDEKHNFRSKLFKKWYDKSNKEGFSKLNIEFKVDEIESYNLEFIFNEAFYTFESVKENVLSQLEEFSNYK